MALTGSGRLVHTEAIPPGAPDHDATEEASSEAPAEPSTDARVAIALERIAAALERR
jgi:hypothetical protein